MTVRNWELVPGIGVDHLPFWMDVFAAGKEGSETVCGAERAVGREGQRPICRVCARIVRKSHKALSEIVRSIEEDAVKPQ